MKHDQLRSIAHNIADSLASGMGFLVGIYKTDVFGEAVKSQEGYITVDFLNGSTEGGPPSEALAKAVKFYQEALPELCKKQGGSVELFKKLTARYTSVGLDRYVLVTIESRDGRVSEDEFIGIPLRHIRDIDHLGRIRKRHINEDRETT